MTSTELLFPVNAKAWATSPLTWALLFWSVPELLPARSTTFPSPVHQSVKPAGGTVHAGGETVRVVLPVKDPRDALMVVLPAEEALANPEGLTVATPGAEDDHNAALVESFVVWLL
ncbi:MAG: hypothetical protein WBE16_06880 [Candidatus Sulfotelmatobacter sp.]